MPRGGRRPGSGAPRGNTNALRSGNRSRRTRESWNALNLLIAQWDEPKLRAIAEAVRAAGLTNLSENPRANLPQLLDVIHPLLVDRPRTTVNQSGPPTTLADAFEHAISAAVEAAFPAIATAAPTDQPDHEKNNTQPNPEHS